MEVEVKSQAQKVINEKSAGKKKNRLLKLKTLLKRKKENRNEKYKVSNYEKIIRKYNDSRQTCKAILNKRLTSGRLRPRKTQEGMFLKGLRTQYIRREPLNEARKNEDINKIIDIGRGSRSYRKSHNSKAKIDKIFEAGIFSSIFDEKDSTYENFTDFERCPISPIRYEPDFSLGNYSQKFSETSAKYNAINKWEKSEIDFHQEFKKFASQIEESVESEIIPKLPRKGVLENALESLRDLYISQQRENNNENAVCKENSQQDSQFLSGYEFIVQNTQPSANTSIGNRNEYLPQNELLIPDEQQFTAIEDWKYHENYEISNIMNSKFQNINAENSIKLSHFSPISQIGNDDINLISPDFITSQTTRGNSTKELSFVTPPIQFYRRNMF